MQPQEPTQTTHGGLRPWCLIDPLRRVKQRREARRKARHTPRPDVSAVQWSAISPTPPLVGSHFPGTVMTVPMFERREIIVDGVTIHLTKREAEMAAALLMCRPRPMRPAELAAVMFAGDPTGGPIHPIIRIWAGRLRAKGVPVINRFGHGYTL